jgi:hypothetical protein
MAVNPQIPAVIKVTGFDGALIKGTVVDANTNLDTMVPVSVEKKNVIKNMTPRFSLLTKSYW